MSASPSRKPERQVRRAIARAVVLYLSLLVADGAIVLFVLLHDFDQRVAQNKILDAHEAGGELARRLSAAVAPDGAIDTMRVLDRSDEIWQAIEDYIAQVAIIDFAELRAPDGRVVLRHRRDGAGLHDTDLPFGGVSPRTPDSPELPPAPWEAGGRRTGAASERVIEVGLEGGAGRLLLGVTPGAIRQEADRLWRAMMFRLLVGGLLSVLLLVVAFLYVLRLIHRTRGLEAEAQHADQLAHLGTVASGLAHEIRNPLNAMNINLQMLEEELGVAGISEDSLGLLRSSRAEVQRLERLVKDFLAFARPPRTRPETLAPSDLVEDVVRFVRPEFRAAGVELELEIGEGAPDVNVEAAQVRQALLNILQNALDVSASGDRVDVRVGATERGEACIDVTDEGPGLEEEQREHIFEVFWSKKPAGSGLGLPIALRAIENHGGRIEVDSEPGVGSTFRIVLPPAFSATQDEHGADDAARAARRAAGRPR